MSEVCKIFEKHFHFSWIHGRFVYRAQVIVLMVKGQAWAQHEGRTAKEAAGPQQSFPLTDGAE